MKLQRNKSLHKLNSLISKDYVMNVIVLCKARVNSLHASLIEFCRFCLNNVFVLINLLKMYRY